MQYKYTLNPYMKIMRIYSIFKDNQVEYETYHSLFFNIFSLCSVRIFDDFIHAKNNANTAGVTQIQIPSILGMII